MNRPVPAHLPFLLAAPVWALTLAACQQTTPMAPASQPGQTPSWGRDFQTKPPQDPAVAHPGQPGGTMPLDAVHGQARPGMGGKGGSGMDWSGGDPTLGKSEYDAKCVRCHGPAGKGGQVPEVGLVPDITTVAMGQRLGDAQVASVVAHGRGKMPSFADGLDGARLKAIVAYVRTLKP